MADNADILCVHLDQLVELARHAEPEDRARLERTIQLARQAFDAVVLAQQLAQRASPLTEEAEADAVHRRGSAQCCAVRVEQRTELRSGSGSEPEGVVSIRWTLLWRRIRQGGATGWYAFRPM